MGEILLGYCGLYCGGCGIHQATRDGKPMAGEDREPLLCDGCASQRLTPWCADCGIKACCARKGYRTCIECADNPCDRLGGFMEDPKYPYHARVQEDMRRLAAIGFPAWEEEMLRRYRCPACGRQVNWFQAACPDCGTVTR